MSMISRSDFARFEAMVDEVENSISRLVRLVGKISPDDVEKMIDELEQEEMKLSEKYLPSIRRDQELRARVLRTLRDGRWDLIVELSLTHPSDPVGAALEDFK